MVICNVAKILELVVPLMEHPSETFLATIEEDLMKLIIKYGMTVSTWPFLHCVCNAQVVSYKISLYNMSELSPKVSYDKYIRKNSHIFQLCLVFS